MKKYNKPLFYTLFMTMISYFLWWHLDLPQPDLPLQLTKGDDLKKEVKNFLYPEATRSDLLALKHVDQQKALLGKKIFFDPAFSSNGNISCASCHIPEKNFSDPRGKSLTLQETRRRTPTAINHFDSVWFFWDGRADSLAAQALGPLEHPGEHGISRWFAVKVLFQSYKKAYESIFGPWPVALPEATLTKLDHALPKDTPLVLDTKIAAYTLASLKDLSRQDKILRSAAKANASPATYLASSLHQPPQWPSSWHQDWERLSKSEQEAINLVFSRIGVLLAEYEKTLIAISSPFDAFGEKLLTGAAKEEDAFQAGFGAKELHGLQVFLSIGCTNCHRGPRFTDDQFHNIGLRKPDDSLQDLDLGRSIGLLLAQNSTFSCLGSYMKKQEGTESCRELPWLDQENLEFVGAFKTPSLRNVAERKPYMHDGSLASLKDVIGHYRQIGKKNAQVGHIEESLKPFDLNEEEESSLMAFLQSLSSEITSL